MPRVRAKPVSALVAHKVEERRRDIVRAAAVLFERDGYHAVSVEDIAQAVGMRKATFYHYVQSKAQIVIWIHDSMMVPLLARLEQMVADALDPRLAIREVMRDILELMDTHPGYLRVFFENHRELPARMRKVATARRDRYEALVEGLLVEGMRRGIFRQLPSRLTVLAMFGITNWSYQWYRPGSGEGFRDVADQLYSVFLGGVETAPALAAPASPPLARTKTQGRT